MTLPTVAGASAPATTTFCLQVHVTTDGDENEMRRLIADYLTEPTSPFIDDLGDIDIWGNPGTGPFIRHVHVQCGETGSVLATYHEQEHIK